MQTCIYLLNGSITPLVMALSSREGCADVQPGEIRAAAAGPHHHVQTASHWGSPPARTGWRAATFGLCRLALNCCVTAGLGPAVSQTAMRSCRTAESERIGVSNPPAPTHSPQQCPADRPDQAIPQAEPKQPALALPLTSGRSLLRLSSTPSALPLSVPVCHASSPAALRRCGHPAASPPLPSSSRAVLHTRHTDKQLQSSLLFFGKTSK